MFIKGIFTFIQDLRDELEIECIDCFKRIEPEGKFTSGQLDIRCETCGALMTITIEGDKIKKLILKSHTDIIRIYNIGEAMVSVPVNNHNIHFYYFLYLYRNLLEVFILNF